MVESPLLHYSTRHIFNLTESTSSSSIPRISRAADDDASRSSASLAPGTPGFLKGPHARVLFGPTSEVLVCLVEEYPHGTAVLTSASCFDPAVRCAFATDANSSVRPYQN